MKLKKALEEGSNLFDGFSIMNDQFIDLCCQTSFSWSSQKGSICLAANKKYFDQAALNTCITGIICPETAVTKMPKDKVVILSSRSEELFYFLHNMAIHESEDNAERVIKPIIAESAHIAPSAIISDQVVIGENVSIGEGVLLLGKVKIGDGTIIHHGGMLGTEGFFSKIVRGRKTHVKHFGGVCIGANCIVHAGTNISRSVNFNEFTCVGDGTHIGVQCNIGHDCVVGKNNDISGRTMLSGRVIIEEGCWIGANSVISNTIHIGSNSKVRIGSVVIDNVHENADVSGNFASKHSIRLKKHMVRRRHERD